MLVVSNDGVHQIDSDGAATLLVDGAVAYAVDDTQGGLVFQLERGRVGEVAPDDRSTVIWWVPRGSSAPQELLVPTPGSGHRLTLHDAYATGDGFAVLYTRHEGSIPDVDMIDSLRRVEVPGGSVAVLHSQGAFEQGFGDVTSNGELVAGTWYQQIGSGCFIDDLDGRPTNLAPLAAGDPTSDDYVEGCRLSPNGDRLAFFTQQYEDNQYISTTIDVWDLVADARVHRMVIPSVNGYVNDIDATAAQLIVNRWDEEKPLAGLVWSLDDPDASPVELPIAGIARFVHTPIDIAAPIRSPGLVINDDSFYSPAGWVGTVYEARPPDSTVYLDGEYTGLQEWAGGCLGRDCVIQFNLVYADTAGGLDGGYDMMIWLTRYVRPPSEVTGSLWREIIDAELVDVPPGYSTGFECSYPNQSEDEWVIALVHRGQEETAVWAWLVREPTGIAAIDVEQVTCQVGDD